MNLNFLEINEIKDYQQRCSLWNQGFFLKKLFNDIDFIRSINCGYISFEDYGKEIGILIEFDVNYSEEERLIIEDVFIKIKEHIYEKTDYSIFLIFYNEGEIFESCKIK